MKCLYKIIIFRLKMIGGLSKALTFKNVNGSCLIDCTLNSILNSHSMLVKLYSLTPESTSLNDDFITLLNSDKNFDGVSSIYKILLSAFVHDYIHNIKNTDKNKLLFSILNSREIMECNKIKDVGNILQERYQRFHNAIQTRIDTFILAGTYLAQMQYIMFDNCIKLYRTLSSALRHFNDIYIILFTKVDEFNTVLDLNKSEIKVINGLFKAAITSTNEYLCTDMILYKGDDVNYMNLRLLLSSFIESCILLINAVGCISQNCKYWSLSRYSLSRLTFPSFRVGHQYFNKFLIFIVFGI